VHDDYLWLLPTVSLLRDADSLLIRGDQGSLPITAQHDAVLSLLLALDGTRAAEDLLARFSFAPRVLAALEAQGWLVHLRRPLADVVAGHPERTRQLSFYAHQNPRFPDRAFEELARSTALIVGVGGVGSYAASVLAGAGIGRLILSDPDTVDPSNLNRQFLFDQRDLGRAKVLCARDALLRRHPQLTIEVSLVDHDSAPNAELPQADLICVCGERRSLWNRPELVGATPLVMAGYFGRVAVVGPAVAPARGTACWACVMQQLGRAHEAAAESHAIGREHAYNSSGASINAIAGGLLGEAATKLLAPSLGKSPLLSTRLLLDTHTLEITREAVDLVCLPGCRHALRPSRPVAARPERAAHDLAE
jgi:molybdopterin/thiamine biosynthesis adenylyltransferase